MNDNIVIVIVNWNGYKDTIECVRSLIDLKYSGLVDIVISDNDSSDGSFGHMVSWLLSFTNAVNSDTSDKNSIFISQNRRITILKNKDNLGYAGGNNVGIKYALKNLSPEFIWILNNDVLVDNNALSFLVYRMKLDPKIGMCGATLLYYDFPEYVQAYGGVTYSYWSGRGKHIGSGQIFSAILDSDIVEAKLSYISGASMFVSRNFIEQVGLMNEDYFLYCEEIDWAQRAKGLFKLAFCHQAIVYHKEGASIGTVSKGKSASLISEFYQARNRLYFTKKYFPRYLPIVWFVLLIHALKRFMSGQSNNGMVMLKVLLGQTVANPEWSVRRCV